MSSDSQSSPAFAQVTKNNHGPWVIVASYIFVICTVLVIVTRLIPRLRIRKVVLNDSLSLVATVFAVAQTICITLACTHGLGRHRTAISESSFETYSKSVYAANILLLASLGCAKASVILLIVSIKPERKTVLACYTVLGVVGLWTVANIFAVAFQCSLPRAWDSSPGRCVNQHALQLEIGVLNIITDVVIIILPYFLMRTVQVSQSKKWTVIGLFATRIIVPIAAILDLVYLNPYFNSTPLDQTWNAVVPTIWTQIMVNLSIITASVPILNRFFADLRTGMMGFGVTEPLELSGSKNTYGNNTAYGNMYASKTGAGLGSKIASKIGVRSQVSKNNMSTSGTNSDDHDMEDLKYGYGRGPTNTGNKALVERSESVKGLTDNDNVIVQTVDYKVEYEGTSDRRGRNQSRHSSPSGDGDRVNPHEL